MMEKKKQQQQALALQQKNNPLFFDKLKGLSFEDFWDRGVGRPEKNAIPMPIFDYEQQLINTLESQQV
jgi:hypothetical protein